MEYIFTDKRGVVHFDLYFTYLESVKELFPPHVYAFAANSQHYSLHDRTSLTLPRFYRHLHKGKHGEIGGDHASKHSTSVYRGI